jgi:hypothetical protein
MARASKKSSQNGFREASKMPFRRIWQIASLVGVLAAAGCGQAKIETYPVTGVVTFQDGEPVPFGVVEFRSSGSAPVARGKIGRDGRFVLGTFTSENGAVAGRHKIIVVQHATIENAVNSSESSHEHTAHETALVHPDYASYEASGLAAEVKPDADNLVSLTVRPFEPSAHTTH